MPSSWAEPEHGPAPYWKCTSALGLRPSQLSLSQGLQEAAEVLRFFFSPFLKVWLKIKGVLKPSPAQKAECVGVM